MGECCGLRRKIHRYWEGNNQRACFLYCLPLAITPLVMGLIFITMGCLAIFFKCFRNQDGYSGKTITIIFLNTLQIMLGLLGFYVVAKKKKALRSLKLLKLSYLIVAYSLFIVQFIILILYLCDEESHSSQTYIYLGVVFGYSGLLILASYEVNSCCSSLRKVYTMGGNGWERKNAAEISTWHKMKLVGDDHMEHLVDVESDI